MLRALSCKSAAGLTLALVCVVAGAGLSALAPVAFKYLLDDLSASAGFAPVLVLAYVACLGCARIAAEGRAFFFGRAEQDIVRSLTLQAASHVLSLPMRFFQTFSSGSLVQTIENGLTGYRLLLQHSVFTLLPGLIEIAVMAVVIFHLLDSSFLVVLAVCAGLYTAVFAGAAGKVMEASREVSAARIRVTSRLSDSLLNIETVKASSGEAALCQRLDASMIETQRAWRRFYTVRSRSGLLVALIFAAGLFAVLQIGLDQIGAGEMTPGGLMLISAYTIQIVRPMELLGYAARDIGQGAAFIERLSAILRATPEARPGQTDEPAAGHAPMRIQLERVCVVQRGGKATLKEIDLDILPGMKVALVGSSGGGKSTLIRLLMGFYEPARGQVLIDGVPLSELAPEVFRRQIAFIAQEPGVFNDSLAFNVGFPDRQADGEAIESALRRVWLAGLLKSSADDLGNQAGERGGRLSGGERQRIAIARALMRRPRLVLADEPTSALDPATEAAILSELGAAFSGVTMVLATHRLRSIQDADLICVLSAGEIVERGTHEELLNAGGVYAGLWWTQARGSAT